MAAAPPDWAAELACPRCRRSLDWRGGAAECPACGPAALLRGGRLPDFVGGAAGEADVVWGWPAGVAPELARHALSLAAGKPLADDALRTMRENGLLAGDGTLTPLGQTVRYHAAEYEAQGRADQFVPSAFHDGLTAASRVLDVGCGAGQSLRRLAAAAGCRGYGVDIDLAALAFGTRLVETENVPVHLLRASGYGLPFPDQSFTHALSRVALNYMHQARALAEIVRVLRPGGLFYGHLEGVGYALRRLTRPASPKALLGALRDASLGLGLELTGRQPPPGTRFGGGSVFATARGVGRTLRRLGCDVLSVAPLGTHLVLPYGVRVLARRR